MILLETLRKDIKPESYSNLEINLKPVEFQKSLRFHFVTKSQITANTNNYDPGDSLVLRINSDASRTITGFQRGVSGRILILINVGAQNIVLADEDANSTAANRMALHGSVNLTLNAEDSIMLWYDITSARWRDIFN